MKSKIRNIRLVCSYLTALVFIMAAGFSGNVLASEHETACKSHIQGKIAWDPTSNYTSASQWEDKNLEYLCKGTTEPKAPGECFHQVMTGHVSYGSSDKWEWKNAVELCAGTSNAEQTVNCFKGKINDKVNWETAIKECQAKRTVENTTP